MVVVNDYRFFVACFVLFQEQIQQKHEIIKGRIVMKFYTVEQILDVKQMLIRTGTGDLTLIKRAGWRSFSRAQQWFPNAKRVYILCGSGTNAGVGFIFAQLAHLAGLEVHVGMTVMPNQLQSESTTTALAELVALGIMPKPYNVRLCSDADYIVDAIFGLEDVPTVSSDLSTIMTSVNQLRKQVLALDLPSGLNANTGVVTQNAILATHTISFLANKLGLATAEGPEHAGNVYLESLGVDTEQLFSVYEPVTDIAAEQVDFKIRYLRRRRDIVGQVLIVGGNEGMLSSIIWASRAATIAGADFVRVITREKHAPFLNMRCPELMAYSDQNVEDLAARSSVVLIGPGLRRDSWTKDLWQQVVFAQKPLVVDSGALRLLATNPLHADNWVLVANHSEAAELLGVTISEVESDRVAAITSLQETYGGVIVLKGFNILVFDGEEVRMGDDVEMITGMSEILSGMIASFIAQGGYSLAEAAIQGVSQFVGQSGDILDYVQSTLRPHKQVMRRAA